MVFVDRHDVVEFGNGPIGAEETAFMEVNGVLCSQALENRELSVGLKTMGWLGSSSSSGTDHGSFNAVSFKSKASLIEYSYYLKRLQSDCSFFCWAI